MLIIALKRDAYTYLNLFKVYIYIYMYTPNKLFNKKIKGKFD